MFSSWIRLDSRNDFHLSNIALRDAPGDCSLPLAISLRYDPAPAYVRFLHDIRALPIETAPTELISIGGRCPDGPRRPEGQTAAAEAVREKPDTEIDFETPQPASSTSRTIDTPSSPIPASSRPLARSRNTSQETSAENTSSTCPTART